MSTLLLQPTGQITFGWDAVVGATNSWEAVDGATPSDAEYVESGTDVGVFNLVCKLSMASPSPTITALDTINFVTLKARAQGQSGDTESRYHAGLHIGGNETRGVTQTIDGNQWYDYAQVLPNPNGGAWTLAALEATDIQCLAINDKGVRLSWFVVEVDYTVEAGGVPGPWIFHESVPAGVEATTVGGLVNGVEYEVQAFAVDTSGNVSAGSALGSGTPSAGTERPHTLRRDVTVPQVYRLRDQI